MIQSKLLDFWESLQTNEKRMLKIILLLLPREQRVSLPTPPGFSQITVLKLSSWPQSHQMAGSLHICRLRL